MPKKITQKVTISAPPKKIYDLLLIPKLHAGFTGAGATGSAKLGGRFTAWDGYIEGKHVELVPGKKIVQAWRASDWPKGEWSEVTYALKPATGGKTTIEFSQTGVPNEFVKSITQGWKEYYWNPMKAYLKSEE